MVECDSSTTADHIYKECDGLEFIQSSNALDLRFIPDSMEIKHSPRDIATEVQTILSLLPFAFLTYIFTFMVCNQVYIVNEVA